LPHAVLPHLAHWLHLRDVHAPPLDGLRLLVCRDFSWVYLAVSACRLTNARTCTPPWRWFVPQHLAERTSPPSLLQHYLATAFSALATVTLVTVGNTALTLVWAVACLPPRRAAARL